MSYDWQAACREEVFQRQDEADARQRSNKDADSQHPQSEQNSCSTLANSNRSLFYGEVMR